MDTGTQRSKDTLTQAQLLPFPCHAPACMKPQLCAQHCAFSHTPTGDTPQIAEAGISQRLQEEVSQRACWPQTVCARGHQEERHGVWCEQHILGPWLTRSHSGLREGLPRRCVCRAQPTRKAWMPGLGVWVSGHLHSNPQGALGMKGIEQGEWLVQLGVGDWQWL